MTTSIVIPSRDAMATYPPAMADAVIAMATAASSDINALQGGGSTAQNFKARAVATVLAAYTGTGTGVITGSANGAIGAQDGVTLAVGDTLFLPSVAITNVLAVDTGPWTVTALGAAGAKYVLTRPSWWAHAGALVEASSVVIGAEGTKWGGNTWRCCVTATNKVIDTDDGTFFPAIDTATTVAMVAGALAAPLTTLYVLKSTSPIIPVPVTPGGTAGILRMSTSTPGQPGTSSLVVTSSAGADTATVKISVFNF